MWNPTSPVTGAAQTGLTTPTYTFVADVAPDANGKQVAVTALGGTQVGVTPHSVASPFTGTFVRPKSFKALGQPNPTRKSTCETDGRTCFYRLSGWG